MTLGDLIRNYRIENKMSMEEFSRRASISKPYVSMLESNKNSKTGKPIVPSIQTVVNVANAMHMTFDAVIRLIDQDIEIITKKQIEPPINTWVNIPLIGRIAAGIPVLAEQNIDSYIAVPARTANKAHGDCYCLTVAGRSMEPEICDGDLVIVDSEVEPSDINIKDSIVLQIDGEATVKHLAITPAGYVLTANNPEVFPTKFYSAEEVQEIPVQIIGKVIGLHRTY